MSKIKLLYYTENYVMGGAERYLCDLLNSVDGRLFDVILLSNPNSRFVDYCNFKLKQKIKIKTIGIKGTDSLKAVNYLKQKMGSTFARKRIKAFKSVPMSFIIYMNFVYNLFILIKIFKSEKLKIIHINNGGYPAAYSCLAAVIAARMNKIPVILMTVNNIAADRRFPQFAEKILDRWVERSSDRIITASEASKESLCRKRGFSWNKLHNIYYGIDLDGLYGPKHDQRIRKEFHLDKSFQLVGMVGSFEKRKGHQYLFNAIPSIIQKVKNVRFVIIGGGENQENIIHLARELGIESHLVFTGYRTDVLSFMSIFDIFVLPSTSFESLPFVILEAMAMGRPVVATKVAGIPEEIVDGVNGLLVPPKDSGSLAKAIAVLLRDRVRAQKMGQMGKKRFKEMFTIDRMIKETLSLYVGILEQKKNICGHTS
jgi:glycosyltransferase involved in cell wall biosynthesis